MQIPIKEVFKRKPTLKTMKKLTLLLGSLFLLTSCEKEFNNVIDPEPVEYQFLSLNVPDVVDLDITPTIVPKIEIHNLPEGSEVWFDVSALFSNELLNSKVVMKDDGQVQTSGDVSANDHFYSGKFTFAATDFSGEYELSFYVVIPNPGGGETQTKIALKTFTFKGAGVNVPPVISNLSMPDSVDTNVDFTITLKVDDVNGLNDIQDTFFLLTDPNGNLAGTFYLYDDGSSSIVDQSSGKTSGDAVSADGLYTRKLSFKTTSAKGNWNLEFKARDKSNTISNIISQKLKLK
jgi:hypothetical protein